MWYDQSNPRSKRDACSNLSMEDGILRGEEMHVEGKKNIFRGCVPPPTPRLATEWDCRPHHATQEGKTGASVRQMGELIR